MVLFCTKLQNLAISDFFRLFFLFFFFGRRRGGGSLSTRNAGLFGGGDSFIAGRCLVVIGVSSSIVVGIALILVGVALIVVGIGSVVI